MSKTLTTGEVAEYCGVHYRTVIRWIESGQLTAYKLPGRGHHRIPVDNFMLFLQTHDMPVPAALSPNKPNILIIEDEQSMARAIARVLNSAHYETHIATNGFRAGVLLIELKPQLITLDINLPGLDGHSILEFIKENKELEHTKILIISAAMPDDLQKMQKSGADAILHKPFANHELIANVENLLQVERG